MTKEEKKLLVSLAAVVVVLVDRLPDSEENDNMKISLVGALTPFKNEEFFK